MCVKRGNRALDLSTLNTPGDNLKEAQLVNLLVVFGPSMIVTSWSKTCCGNIDLNLFSFHTVNVIGDLSDQVWL